MASAAFDRSWASASEDLRAALADAGADDPVSIARLVRGTEVAAEVLDEIYGPSRVVAAADLHHFDELRHLATRVAHRRNEKDAQRGDHESLVQFWKEAEEKKRKKEEAFFEVGGGRAGDARPCPRVPAGRAQTEVATTFHWHGGRGRPSGGGKGRGSKGGIYRRNRQHPNITRLPDGSCRRRNQRSAGNAVVGGRGAAGKHTACKTAVLESIPAMALGRPR